MIRFATKLLLSAYVASNPREGKYLVEQDETLQNKQTIYSYMNEELFLESGGSNFINWLPTVNTFADIATTYLTPIGLDAVIVTADETHNNNKTWYKHDGYNWIYKGAYHKRETYTYTSLKGTRPDVLVTGSPLPIEFEYIVGNKELDLYLDGVLSSQYLKEYGDLGFTSKAISLLIDVPNNTNITVRKFVANVDDEPRTNDDTFVAATIHNWDAIDLYVKYNKTKVINYDNFTDVLNDTLLNKENQVIRTLGHTTKNDGKGRYWILETTDKDFAFKTKSGNYFINRLIGADELQIGAFIPYVTGAVAPPETVIGSGQLANRVDYKRIYNLAVANGWVVTEAEWTAGKKGYFSSGDGVNTFRFPDFTDRFVRVKGSLVAVGTAIADTYESHNHSASETSAGAHTHSLTLSNRWGTQNRNSGGFSGDDGVGTTVSRTTDSQGDHTHTLTINNAGSTETAPKHIAEPFYIKI